MAPSNPQTSLSERSVADNVIISLRKIIRAIDMNSKKLSKRVGLTGPQLVLLNEISRSGDITAGEIAQAVSLSQATVTGILERLGKRGLVIKQRSEHDKRRIMVSITDAGHQILETKPPLMQDAFVEKFSSLQEWEQTMILSALQRLVSIMDAKAIDAAPFLSTGPVVNQPAKGDAESPPSF